MHRRSVIPAVVLLSTACNRAGAPSALATAKIDTLPGGIVRVSNPGPTAWTTDTSGWRLVEDLAITGAGDTVAELSNPSGLAVDGQGRIYVSDGLVKLYTPDGKFLRVIGRDGAGPGEYRGANIATSGDQLVLEDISASRVSLFDSAGKYLTSWPIQCCAPRPPAADSAGRILVWNPESGPDGHVQRWLRHDGDGAVDTLQAPDGPAPAQWKLKTGGGGATIAVPFSPMTSVVPTRRGGLVYGWGGRYELIWTRTGRDTALIFGRDWTPAPIAEGRKRAAVDRYVSFYVRNGRNMGGVDSVELVRTLSLGDVPATPPAFTWLLEDPAGNLWVVTDAGDDTLQTRFDVFDPTGRYLGPVRAPAQLLGYPGYSVVGREAVYAIEQTSDGLPVVKRYRIEKGPTGH
jgi:hypothetical protein